jgi:small GTP-binding protein
MVQRKICLIGGPAVGKTSLVARFARNFFTERHLATIGVRIDKRAVDVQGQEVLFVIWDLAGASEFTGVATRYLRGAAGYLLAIDGTRVQSLAEARRLHMETRQRLGQVPFIAVMNKVDLETDWQVTPEMIDDLSRQGWSVLRASAKTGLGVEQAFRELGERILGSGAVRPAPPP